MSDLELHSVDAIKKQLTNAITNERIACLRHILKLHNAEIEGVSPAEAAEWLGLPPTKSSETAVGILLRKLGYVTYRRSRDNRTITRAWLVGKQAEGWKRR